MVETVQKDNICHITITPAQVSADAGNRALAVASRAIAALEGAGIFGVELFLMPDDSILLNEIAPRCVRFCFFFGGLILKKNRGSVGPSVGSPTLPPTYIRDTSPPHPQQQPHHRRPHNSGHYTMEACETDQFENHLRAILDLPLGGTALRVGAAVMLNILGEGNTAETKALMQRALAIPGAGLHWYGKGEAKAGRKMAHITFVGHSLYDIRARAAPYGLLNSLPLAPEVGGCERGIWIELFTLSVIPPLPQRYRTACCFRKRHHTSNHPRAQTPRQVGIIMGSDSDLPTMKDAAEVLEAFGVKYELTIVSAHRTPERMYKYAQSAARRGVQVRFVCGSWGAVCFFCVSRD